MKLPSISIVTATYNSSQTLEKCLQLVREQNYPQEKIEIVLGDGGSTDSTSQIAQKYHAKIVAIPRQLQNAEYNRGVAFNKAKNDLVLILDHDNYMPSREYLRQLVQPLLDYPEAVASESCYYHYNRNYSALDRYYALFGTLDPVPYYLGKADRLPQTSHSWTLQGRAQDKGNYYIVDFDANPRFIPTIGTNGCLMRRKLVVENADVRPQYHYPIDVMVDVIKSGHRRFAFVKNSLIHLTGARGLIPFLRRRLRFMQDYHFASHAKRRYSVYWPGDEWSLVKFVFFSITLIKPSWDAFRGFLIIPDPAWFLHPLMCLGVCLVYGWGTITSSGYEHPHS